MAGGGLAPELEGIADQVLEDLHELGGVHRHAGQRFVGDAGLGGVDPGLEIVQGLAEHPIEFGRGELRGHGSRRGSSPAGR